jgi:hypothetical protein
MTRRKSEDKEKGVPSGKKLPVKLTKLVFNVKLMKVNLSAGHSSCVGKEEMG